MDYLVRWNAAKLAIDAARSIDELKDIRDKAEALRQYAKQAKETLDVQNKCAEIKLRCERRMGGMLQETQLNKGAATPSHDVTALNLPKLEDVGISRMQSSRYQTIARLPEQAFENHIVTTQAQAKELTEAGIIAFVKQTFRAEDIANQRENIKAKLPQMPKGEYDIITIDPPWPYGNVDDYDPKHYMGRVSNPYPEMTIEEIHDIQLPTSNDCVLWMWTTHKYMRDAFNIMETWGFEFKAILTWNKESMGIGKWLRKQCEFCLLGIKGKPKWLANDIRDILTVQKKQHSRKPDEFYTLVERASEGRKLDVFGRQEREGWTTWGNDTNKFNKKKV